jgi:predicted phosphodiesterase
MKLWLMSDTHLESTKGWDLPPPDERPDYDVLVMAGDLIPRMERGVAWLLDRVSDRPCVYVHGNHEGYGTDLGRTIEKAKMAAAGTNVHVLERETIRLGDITFAGCCLWTDFALRGDPQRAMTIAADRMNDYRRIRTDDYRHRFRPHHALTLHTESMAFLESEMRKPRGNGRLVVVTHFAPIPEMSAEYGGSGNDPGLDPSYRSDLTRLMSPAPDDGRGALRPADIWCFGHTHESFNAVIGSTRVVSNAKGYGRGCCCGSPTCRCTPRRTGRSKPSASGAPRSLAPSNPTSAFSPKPSCRMRTRSPRTPRVSLPSAAGVTCFATRRWGNRSNSVAVDFVPAALTKPHITGSGGTSFRSQAARGTAWSSSTVAHAESVSAGATEAC